VTSTSNQGEARSPDFVVFSDDWGEHPSSCQHIFRHIAKNHRVLWVNTIGMRNPTFTLTDFRKVFIKVGKMLRLRREQNQWTKPVGRLRVCQPIMLPFSGMGLVRKFNAWSVTRKVRSALRAMNLRDPIIVSTVPNAAEYPKILMGHRVVYYCVDDFSLWPGLDSTRVSNMEQRLIEESDMIIAASDTLAKKLIHYKTKIAVLTHGVDLAHFGSRPNSEHLVLGNIPEPRVGFFGLIDGRFDGELVRLLSTRMPHISFVIAGPIDATAGTLPVSRNLHFTGGMPYEDLPSFIVGMRALILPYKVDALGEKLSPLKLKEYLATRKPVVSTPILAVREFSNALFIAQGLADWISALQGIIEQGRSNTVAEIETMFAAETWCAKADKFLVNCQAIERRGSFDFMRKEMTCEE
jgi:glycosyltransferase involved in cell wall biosynthesis